MGKPKNVGTPSGFAADDLTPYGPNLALAARSSRLRNVRSIGDTGQGSEDFEGSYLSTRWGVFNDTPSYVVGNSFLEARPDNTAAAVLTAFTPTGACRVEVALDVYGCTLDLFIRDLGTSEGAAVGNGMLVRVATASGAQAQLLSFDNGNFDGPIGSALVLDGNGIGWSRVTGYLALARNAANQWSAYYSVNRALWIPVGTPNYAKTFTVAQMGFRLLSGISPNSVSVDFIDVVQ